MTVLLLAALYAAVNTNISKEVREQYFEVHYKNHRPRSGLIRLEPVQFNGGGEPTRISVDTSK